MTELPGNVPTISLHDGTRMPQLGFGVWRVPDDEAQVATEEALRVGYRLIDTAAVYRNEEGVGRAIAASGIARDELYVTTKLWNSDQGYDNTLRGFDVSLGKLGIETVNLYLLHWPAPAFDLYAESWKALVELHRTGRVGSIGVSNFHAPHLQRIIDETGVVPVVNQIELHPHFQQREMRKVNAGHGIVTEAYSPLGAGEGLLDDPVLARIAEAHGSSPAQVALAWSMRLGHVVIPKSVTPSRIAENLGAVAVSLSDEDVAAIDGLDRGARVGTNPDEANFGKPRRRA